jgi:hypothetical protein
MVSGQSVTLAAGDFHDLTSLTSLDLSVPAGVVRRTGAASQRW